MAFLGENSNLIDYKSNGAIHANGNVFLEIGSFSITRLIDGK